MDELLKLYTKNKVLNKKSFKAGFLRPNVFFMRDGREVTKIKRKVTRISKEICIN